MKKRLQGLVCGIVIGAMLASGVGFAKQIKETAELVYNNIKITLNGEEVEPKDVNGNTVEPFIIDGTTYLPVRAIAGALGIDVDWDGETNTVILNEKTEEKSLGNTLLAAFEEEAKTDKNVLEIAEALMTNEAIKFAGGAMPVEEGLLSGFDNTEIKGFKSGAVFMPMIGSIPFVGYVFELEDESKTEEFIANLEANANLRWNICVTADEMVTGALGNKVFFVMCPTSLE